MELKPTEIALNRSKNHIRERTTGKGVQVVIFLLKIPWYFKTEVGIASFFFTQILIISPLRNARRGAH